MHAHGGENVRKLWLRNIAIAMGMASATTAWAQYPTYNPNIGPSSYPVQQPVAPVHQPVAGPQQIPAPYNYQLTNWQESVPSVPGPGVAPGQHEQAAGHIQAPYNQVAPQVNPVPIAPQYAPAQQPMQYSQPTPMPYAQQQAIAPGCSSCGQAPVSQSMGGYPGYSTGTPYAYSAPSMGYAGGACGPSVAPMRGHFAQGLPPGAKPYFFGANALIFRRIDDYNRTLSINDATGAAALSTRDAQLGTMGGIELMAGRYFNCGKNAIVASYWGLYPENEMVAITDAAGGYRSVLFRPWVGPAPTTGEFQLQMAAAPNTATDPDLYNVYDTATSHRLRRSSNFNNIEINILGFAAGGAARSFNRSTAGTMFSGSRHHMGHHMGQGYGSCGSYGSYGDCGSSCGSCGDAACNGSCGACEDNSRYATGPCGYIAPGCASKMNITWIAGVRYLQFEDNLEYAAFGGPTLGASTVSYDIHTRNHLVGFQIGGRADYCVGSRMNLYGLGKAGIYGNHASMDSRLGTELYTAYTSNDPTMPYSINRRSNDVAFLSELGTGVGYRFSPKWTATVGYRAIVASGVATAVGNIRYQGQSISGTGINAQDYLVLHGLNVGALYNF